MSEYQYYEFLAVDKTLSPKEIEAVGAFSSRAEMTASRFQNVYNFGDFRGSVENFLTRYYDLHVYLANWGTHTFAMGLPAKALDLPAWKPYLPRDGIAELQHRGDRAILTFTSSSEGGDEDYGGEEWMAPLAPLREELLAGDLRVLYLGFLASFYDENTGMDDDVAEPPVPPGLRELTPAQSAFVEFMRIDDDLLATAAKASPPRKQPALDARRWLQGVPAEQKDAWLLELLEGRHIEALSDLRARLRETSPSAAAVPTGRTVGELRAVAEGAGKERQRIESEHAARRRAQAEAEKVRARAEYLASIAPRRDKLWEQVEQLIATRLPKNYDQAVALLVDLRDLAARPGSANDFQDRFTVLRQRHQGKSSVQARFRKAGLL